jgi:transcriptional regulator with XRE-family HTH domain
LAKIEGMQGGKSTFAACGRQEPDHDHSIIGKYERDQVKPTVDVVMRLADVLVTTVGFLMGESEEMNVLKDPGMLKRLNDLVSLPQKDKEGILYVLDGLLRDAKTRLTYH